MTKNITALGAIAVGFGITFSVATARLPAPSDEAKAKAAEAAAKGAHAGKVENYKLCLSMNAVAAKYASQAKAAGKTVTPTATPECTDPGPYVSPTAAAGGTGAAAPQPSAATKAAPAAAVPAKKS
jgi:hypothetical protein